MRGGAVPVLSPQISTFGQGRMRQSPTVATSYSPTGETLTPRMRQVLRSAATGNPARITALELHISEHTVRAIRAAACSRLGVPNVVAAVAELGRRGELQ